jgi:hypothetical protein
MIHGIQNGMKVNSPSLKLRRARPLFSKTTFKKMAAPPEALAKGGADDRI